jgi:hypothetical protein
LSAPANSAQALPSFFTLGFCKVSATSELPALLKCEFRQLFAIILRSATKDRLKVS